MKAWLCLKMGQISVGGVERKADNEHMIGIAPVFDDYECAKDFVHGDETAILLVDVSEPPK